MKKIVITGANGFIGTHLTAYFKKNSAYCVFPVVYSGQDTISHLTELVQKEKPDIVINAAGSANVAKSVKFPLEDFEANVNFHMQVLDTLRSNPCKYLYLSSAAIYGNPQVLPVDEKHPITPISPYGWHKYFAEQICQEYAQLYGVHTAAVRLFSVYGPGQKKLFFYDLYNKFKTSNGEIVLAGTGDETRDFVYVNDILVAIEKVISHAPMLGEYYNVASGTETSIRHATEEFIDIYGIPAKIVFGGKGLPGYPVNWVGDIDKIKQLGFEPVVSLRDGLINTIQWLKENA